jgi:hypothetical protein
MSLLLPFNIIGRTRAAVMYEQVELPAELCCFLPLQHTSRASQQRARISSNSAASCFPIDRFS